MEPLALPGSASQIPCVIGSVAFLKQRADLSSGRKNLFRWYVYLRKESEAGLSFSQLVEKVTFRLDKSFKNPVRSVEKPPYFICDEAWAESYVDIEVSFKDIYRVKNASWRHCIRLYHPDRITVEKKSFQGGEKGMLLDLPLEHIESGAPVVWEKRDLIAFVAPSQQLLSGISLNVNNAEWPPIPAEIWKLVKLGDSKRTSWGLLQQLLRRVESESDAFREELDSTRKRVRHEHLTSLRH